MSEGGAGRRHLYTHERPRFLRRGPRVLLNSVVPLDDAAALSAWHPQAAPSVFIGPEGWAASALGHLGGLRVLLVRCPSLSSDPRAAGDVLPALGLGLLAGLLGRHGARVAVLDLKRECDIARTLPHAHAEALARATRAGTVPAPADPAAQAAIDHLLEGAPGGGFDLIGLSADDDASLPVADLLGRALARRSAAAQVLGGRGAARLPGDAPSSARWTVLGEGEYPLLRLASALAAGRAPGAIPGVRGEGGPSTVALDLDLRAPPDFDGLDLDGYSPRGRFLPYQLSLGCPRHCAFCNSYANGAFRVRAPERAVEDLRRLHERHRVDRFLFLDHLVNLHYPSMRRFAELLSAAGLGLAWADCARPTGLSAADLRALAAAGARRLFWGVDTVAPGLAARMGKNQRIEEVSRVLRAANDAGIENVANVIVGFPGETEADFEALLRFLEAHRRCIGWVAVHPFRLAPTSLLGVWPADYAPPGRPGPEYPDPECVARRVRALTALGEARVFTGVVHSELDTVGPPPALPPASPPPAGRPAAVPLPAPAGRSPFRPSFVRPRPQAGLQGGPAGRKR